MLIHQTSLLTAVSHALWEAHECIHAKCFCASHAMLRKALDLWSREYVTAHSVKFDSKAGEKNDLYWRHKKIAADNALYAGPIHQIMDDLRDEANGALHGPTMCHGGADFATEHEKKMRDLQHEGRVIYEKVATLIKATTTNLPSTRERWGSQRPPR